MVNEPEKSRSNQAVVRQPRGEAGICGSISRRNGIRVLWVATESTQRFGWRGAAVDLGFRHFVAGEIRRQNCGDLDRSGHCPMNATARWRHAPRDQRAAR
jgi:hypothetical protein